LQPETKFKLGEKCHQRCLRPEYLRSRPKPRAPDRKEQARRTIARRCTTRERVPARSRKAREMQVGWFFVFAPSDRRLTRSRLPLPEFAAHAAAVVGARQHPESCSRKAACARMCRLSAFVAPCSVSDAPKQIQVKRAILRRHPGWRLGRGSPVLRARVGAGGRRARWASKRSSLSSIGPTSGFLR
jgi:hypothetical protein